MSAILATLRGWLDAARAMPSRLPELAALVRSGWPAVAVAFAAGLGLLVAGARLRRVLCGAGGAVVGYWAGGLLAPAFRGWIPAGVVGWVGASVVGTASLLWPVLYPLALGLVPGALLGAQVEVAGTAWLAAVAGGAGLALALVLLRRLVVAATAAAAGAGLVTAALLGAAARVPALAVLARRPVLTLGLAAVLAVAGTAFQLGARVEGRRAPRAGRGGGGDEAREE